MKKKQKAINKKVMNKEKKGCKKTNLIYLFIAIIIIAIVIIICVMIAKKDTPKEKVEQLGEDIIEQEMPEYSLIDMNNTENAQIKEGTKENTSAKLAEEKEYKGMKIKNIKLVAEGGVTRLTATVENTTSQNYEGGEITIVFTNVDGSEFARLEGILPAIDSGKSNELDAGTTADIANSYDFRIE